MEETRDPVAAIQGLLDRIQPGEVLEFGHDVDAELISYARVIVGRNNEKWRVLERLVLPGACYNETSAMLDSMEERGELVNPYCSCWGKPNHWREKMEEG
jgi:hypothetical protein